MLVKTKLRKMALSGSLTGDFTEGQSKLIDFSWEEANLTGKRLATFDAGKLSENNQKLWWDGRGCTDPRNAAGAPGSISDPNLRGRGLDMSNAEKEAVKHFLEKLGGKEGEAPVMAEGAALPAGSAAFDSEMGPIAQDQMDAAGFAQKGGLRLK